jgi:hypothetical protein
MLNRPRLCARAPRVVYECEALAHLTGCLHRPEGIILVQLGEAEHSDDRVTDELLDLAAELLDGEPLSPKYRVITRRNTFGSSRSTRGVDPTTSQNTAVTVFRSCPTVIGSTTTSGAAQASQNRAPTRLTCPQSVQVVTKSSLCRSTLLVRV